MAQSSKPRQVEVQDAVSKFLADPANRATTYPASRLPPVSEGPLTDAERKFLAKSTFEHLED